MVSESLARKFKPAGFEQPEGSRQNYTKPRPELQEAFYRWVEGLPEEGLSCEESENQYKKAVKTLEDFSEIPYREANSLLVDFKPKTKWQKEAGLFVSACYTHSPEETIVFDVDAPEIACIGYKTKKNIFNNGKVGDLFAYSSSSLAVNNGNCGNEFAWKSSGLAVNNGNCGDRFAWYSSDLVVAVIEPKGYGWKGEGRAIKPEDCTRIPDLKNYLDELEEITKAIKDEESAKRFLGRYGSQPAERIEYDIEDILKTKIGYLRTMKRRLRRKVNRVFRNLGVEI